MNLSAEISLLWAGEDRTFALKAKPIEGLEHDCGEGIGKICMRVFAQTEFTYRHLHRTIYWGLIGGGTSPTEAARLVETYVHGQPIDPIDDPSSTFKTAKAILQAVYFGWERLPSLGEAQAGETRPNSPTSDFTAQPSTEPA